MAINLAIKRSQDESQLVNPRIVNSDTFDHPVAVEVLRRVLSKTD